MRDVFPTSNGVNALARLARLDLRPEEATVFTAQLPKILDYVGQLQKVETEIVPEVTPPGRGWRDDQAEPSTQSGDILQQAPERDDRFWRVPSVF